MSDMGPSDAEGRLLRALDESAESEVTVKKEDLRSVLRDLHGVRETANRYGNKLLNLGQLDTWV